MKRKNIFKSLLAAAMALIMIFGAAPLSGFVGIRLPMLSLKAEAATTEDGLFEYEVERRPWTEPGYKCEVRITRYKGPDSGEVVVPKTIEGYEVKRIGGGWQYKVFQGYTGITSIVIPDSVISIGGYAFSYCTSLAEITIPDSVTSIGEFAFLGCTSLSKVDLPKNLTGIYSGVFSGCTSLAEITIPDSVISIDRSAFSGCTSLAEITVSPDNKNYSSVDGVLFNKDGSELIIYPKGNGRSAYTVPDGVTSISGSAFSGCTSLKEIVIPDSVTTIGSSAFEGCTSLSKVKLSNNLRIIRERTFYDCTSLAEIVIPDSVTEISGRIDTEYYGGAFIGCTSLAEIVIPDSVTEIGESAFKGCTSLSKVKLPKNLTGINWGVFSDCKSLAEIVIPDSVTSIGGYAFSGCTSLAEITIPDSVTKIGSSAFSGCTSLSKVDLPKDLTTIEARTFRDCTSLAEITIPDSVTSIGGAFSGCTSLAEITIPDSVTEIGESTFFGCTSLAKVKLSTNLTIIEAGTFSGCTSLKEIVIPDSVTEIRGMCYSSGYDGDYDGGAFSGCTSLAEIDIPDSVTSIGGSVFSNCTSLESITIGSGVESLDDEWIASCRRLENITVSPENKTYSSVDGVLFNKDKSELSAYPIGNKRSSYTIPDGVEKIGKKAFYGCRYIESLTIPVSVAEIEASALGNCYDIRAVYYLGTREQWKEVVIGADNYMFALVNVRCADDSQCRHVWGEWEVVEEATYEKDGLERRVCSLCKAEQTRKIPRLGAVKVDAIELSESEKKLNVGKSFTITATVKPDNAWNRTVTWSSSDPSIATVDENGTVTAIAEGEAIITAESADGVTAECKVTVEKKESFGKKLLNVITAPFRAIINLFKKLFGK